MTPAFASAPWRRLSAIENRLTHYDLRIAWLIYGAAWTYAVVIFFRTWNQPIIELYGFRQAQTALTVYWGIKDGWHLAYETPVLGAPWSVPFELPLFQWLVSLVWKLTKWPLDNCGRFTSFAFHLAASAVLIPLLARIGLRRSVAIVAGALFLMAPVNFFWGRAFLIESCALFVALTYLLVTVVAVDSYHRLAPLRKALIVAAATALAAIAAVTKITTFAVPAVMAAILVAGLLARAVNRDGLSYRKALLAYAMCVGIPAAVSLAALIGWTGFSDAVKSQNPMGAYLTSSALTGWNFGNLQQRLSGQLWWHTIVLRSVRETLGLAGAAFVLGALLLWLRGWKLVRCCLFVAGYLLVFLLFPNLQTIHSYYQYSAAVWLVCAAAFVLGSLRERSVAVFLGSALLVLVSQASVLVPGYQAIMTHSLKENQLHSLNLAQKIKSETRPDDVVVLLGRDWSSEVGYYAERRTITTPKWDHLPAGVLAAPAALAAPYRFAGVVNCDNAGGTELIPAIEHAAGMPSFRFEECAFFLVPPAGGGERIQSDPDLRTSGMQLALPPEEPNRYTPLLPLAAEESVSFQDRCNVETANGVPFAAEALVVSRRVPLTVDGWVLDAAGKADPAGIAVVLWGSEEKSWRDGLFIARKTRAVSRPDVASAFSFGGDPDSLGFSSTADPAALPPGEYRVLLLFDADGHRKLCGNGRRIRIAE